MTAVFVYSVLFKLSCLLIHTFVLHGLLFLLYSGPDKLCPTNIYNQEIVYVKKFG